MYIIVENSPNSSHLYDHGFMDVIPIVRQSANKKKIKENPNSRRIS